MVILYSSVSNPINGGWRDVIVMGDEKLSVPFLLACVSLILVYCIIRPIIYVAMKWEWDRFLAYFLTSMIILSVSVSLGVVFSMHQAVFAIVLFGLVLLGKHIFEKWVSYKQNASASLPSSLNRKKSIIQK